jgi:tetrapyrrole methylase family protein/MazG family protein
MHKDRYTWQDLLEIMARLRAPGGCPWDREQTHESLLQYLIEESAELQEAVLAGDETHVREELGDVLLQVVFHAQIAKEQSRYGIEEVIDGVSRKLVERHPHVFVEGQSLETASQVESQWEEIKKGEKGVQERRKSLMDEIPAQLPGLQYATKTQWRAAKVGFDWPSPEPIFDKIFEEVAEVSEASELEPGPHRQERLEDELGDLLFAVANLCRKYEVPPEQALQKASRKFAKRFRAMEAMEAEAGPLKGKSLDELEELWVDAKLQVG